MTTITSKALLALEPNKTQIVEITVDPPKKGEVRLKILYTSICHTDLYTLSGKDPEGIFPAVLGHEGVGEVESVGEDVKDVKVGDVVIPLYTPECRQCKFCKSGKTNLCQAIRVTQGKGQMPDGTSRFKYNGKEIAHYMGCSTFSQYTVVSQYSCAVINPKANLANVCLIGCGITTGYGASTKTTPVTKGSNCAVFGLGGVGLGVVQGCKKNQAGRIIGIDMNPKKHKLALEMGCTEVINPADLPKDTDLVSHLQKITDGGLDYTFEAIGNVSVMRQALESCHKGWGISTIIGVAASGQEINTRPFQLVTGRQWRGCAFGGVKGRTEVPGIVEDYMRGDLKVDEFVTHTFKFKDMEKAMETSHGQECIRAVVDMRD